MTNKLSATAKGVIRPSKYPQSADSVRLHLLMEEAHKLAIGGRIKQLRERSPYGQPAMQRLLGYKTLRGYQKIEEGGTTSWERVEAVAKIHKADPFWIWDGDEREATPDPFQGSDGRILEQIAELRVDVAELGVDLAQGKAQQQKWRKRRRGLGSSEAPE